MFFSFQLALPKTSVLLLCQHNSRFLTFFILFFAPLPLSFAFGTFRSLPFGSLLVFLFYVVSFAVFLGQYSLFFNACLFQQPFSYLFYIAFSLCFFPFAFETFCPLPFGSLPVVFLFSVVSFAVFWGQYSLFFNVCLFQQSFPYLFYIVFAPLPFSLCFWAFRPLPFSILQTVFCPLPFTSPFCCFLSFLCVEFTFCITFDGNLLQKFVTRQKV